MPHSPQLTYRNPHQLRYAGPAMKRPYLCSALSYTTLRRVLTRCWITFAQTVTPLARLHFSNHTFQITHMHYRYVVAAHNVTWTNERAVELGYAEALLARFSNEHVLEVGNVLRQYFSAGWEVCDKYDYGPGINNVDVRALQPNRNFKLIISLSTLEHVGFDEPVMSRTGFVDSVSNLRRFLAPDGELHITVPIGYNPDVDNALLENTCAFQQVHYLRRIGWMKWVETTKDDALKREYGQPYPCANSLAICVLQAD